MPHFARPHRAALILVLALAGLSGCGRRGPLDLPPEVTAQPREAVVQKTTVTPEGSKKPVAEEVRAVEYIPGTTGFRPPERYPFILDPLLD
ncbi:lipoprotein [Methylosinus sp. Sm6]|uniref:LPS translocon maturation chaperone LptM n=1 Tax=Methylosinus sp. Sm6 TaxID=2866948 RepID=UPI001C99569A|nr:lipoprotein [Methylosinus sp. Sm6]MBY6241735.1 lipoprotein [Methylosinus sp. Sm6]